MNAAERARALRVALLLAARGLSCFPCRLDKAPACPRGFRAAVSDPLYLTELWQRYPGPLVGVATGAMSGIDALDIDAPRHPEAAEWWVVHRHYLPRTRIHRTPSGGIHVLFRHAADLRCWAARPVVGIDGRADGGYIVWWPTVGELILSAAPIAPWPRWLLGGVSAPQRASCDRVTIPDTHALAGLVRKVASACKGHRNSIAFCAACRAGEMVASGLIADETAVAVIINAAVRSGLSQIEAERTAWSGIRIGSGSEANA